MSHRVRLTKQGSAYLTDYVRTINPYPMGDERCAVLNAVRAIPGNEHFTMGKLSGWFSRHRSQSQGTAPALDDETVLFPKLTQTQLQQLRTLYKKRNDPPDNIITFWAGRIKADRDEVAAWIDYQREKAKANDVDAASESLSPDFPLRRLPVDPVYNDSTPFPRPHLPTPAQSLSPTITWMPTIKQEEPRQISPLSPSDTLLSPYSPSILNDFPPLSRQQNGSKSLNIGHQPVPKNLRGQPPPTLADSIRQSLRAPTEPPPRTAGELDEMFDQVKNQAEAFLKKYDSGQLARLGWDPSLARAAP